MQRRVLFIALSSLLLAHFASSYALISARQPYPLYHDEEYVSETAWRMVERSTLQPGFYRYGSLPMYLGAAAMSVSRALSPDPDRAAVSVSFPHYVQPQVMASARLLFAAIAALGLLGAGLCAARAYGHWELALCAPFSLACSAWYTRQSWSYLNVDIVAAAITLIALAYLVYSLQARSFFRQVIVPALLCGAIGASKYNSALLALPFLLNLLLGKEPQRVQRAAAFCGLCVGAFIMFEPYSVLDHRRFLADVMHEIRHYQTGHRNQTTPAGLPQLFFYLSELGRDFGALFSALGLGGIYCGLRRDKKLTLLLLSFPVAMLIHMSTNKTHFVRSVLPVFGVFAIFIGVGMRSCAGLLQRTLLRAKPTWASSVTITQRARVAAWCLVLGLCCTLGPVAKAIDIRKPQTDSRLQAAQWLRVHAAQPCVLLVEKRLGFAPQTLGEHCELQSLDLEKLPSALTQIEARHAPRKVQRFVLLPRWSAAPDRPQDILRAESWNQALSPPVLGAPVLRTGDKPMLVNRRAIEGGDPALALYRLQP